MNATMIETALIDMVIRQWTRIGAGFGAEPAAATPDLERLLLETARHAPGMARLFIMAATWLHTYGDLVARHRLRRLIREELGPEHRPTLGLLLDLARAGIHPQEFATVLRELPPASPPCPLFDSEQESARLSQRAERRSSDIARRWGLWCAEFEFKDDALRPPRWVMENNPTFVARAYLRGDLRASVLAALRHDPGAGESELALARCAGGSRAQVRNALRSLELAGKVTRQRRAGTNRTTIELVERIESGDGVGGPLDPAA